jgi:hypothetical protein
MMLQVAHRQTVTAGSPYFSPISRQGFRNAFSGQSLPTWSHGLTVLLARRQTPGNKNGKATKWLRAAEDTTQQYRGCNGLHFPQLKTCSPSFRCVPSRRQKMGQYTRRRVGDPGATGLKPRSGKVYTLGVSDVKMEIPAK